MDFYFIALILHRLGIILIILSSTVILTIPSLLKEPGDYEFARTAHNVIIGIANGALLLLIFSGSIRLFYELPPYLWIKLILVILTALSFFGFQTPYNDKKITKIIYVRLICVFLTSTMGLVLFFSS